MTKTYQGKDCPEKHGGLRYAKSRCCVNCQIQNQRRIRAENAMIEITPVVRHTPAPNIARSSFIQPITKAMLQARRAP